MSMEDSLASTGSESLMSMLMEALWVIIFIIYDIKTEQPIMFLDVIIKHNLSKCLKLLKAISMSQKLPWNTTWPGLNFLDKIT